jgi:hypothetical protein
MAGQANYLRNMLVDFLFRGQSATPPASVFVALCSTAPTAGAAGTELTGTGYARVEVPCTATDWLNTQGTTAAASNGTTGTTRNAAIVDFGAAGSNWGLVSHWELYDAATGGNRLVYGEIVDANGANAPRTVVTNDPVSFPASGLFVQFN